jgi:hypothetical protein
LCDGSEKDLLALKDFLKQPIHTDGVTALELRTNIPATVEDLVSRIADLVLERQSLRSHEADSALLERNRLALVRAHQDLSYALIDRHCPPKADAAEAAA